MDDHAASRAAVGAVVASLGGAIVAEADTAVAGLTLVERLRPDAVVLAVGLPDRDGLDVAGEIITPVAAGAGPDAAARGADGTRRAGD